MGDHHQMVGIYRYVEQKVYSSRADAEPMMMPAVRRARDALDDPTAAMYSSARRDRAAPHRR
jgi:hypothetical protein